MQIQHVCVCVCVCVVVDRQVIPRISTHEPQEEDISAVYKRRRREDKEEAARRAQQRGVKAKGRDEEDEDGEDGGTGTVRTLDGEEVWTPCIHAKSERNGSESGRRFEIQLTRRTFLLCSCDVDRARGSSTREV